MGFGRMNRDLAHRALSHTRRPVFIAVIVLLQASGAGAQSIDVNRLVGLDPTSSEQRQAESSIELTPDAATADTGSTDSRGRAVVEPIPIDHVPTTWLVRDESGSATLVCARGAVPPERRRGESRGGERVLK